MDGIQNHLKKKPPQKTPPGLLKTSLSSNTEEGDPSENPFPDIFTLSIGSVVNLDGIMLLSGGKVSGSDGWILDYTVETSLDGVTWNLSATVQRNNLVLRLIRFDDGPLNVKHLRVIITAAKDSFSRILELSPVYAVSNSSTNPLGASTTTPPPVSSKTKSNTMEIVASLLGGLAGILLGLLAYVLWLLRKQRNGGVGDPQKRPVGDFSFHKPVVSELGNHHPDSVTTYPRSELA